MLSSPFFFFLPVFSFFHPAWSHWRSLIGAFRLTLGIFGVESAYSMFERCYDFPLFHDFFFCHFKDPSGAYLSIHCTSVVDGVVPINKFYQ